MKKIIIGLLVLTSFSSFANERIRCGMVIELSVHPDLGNSAELEYDQNRTQSIHHMSQGEFTVLQAAYLKDRRICIKFTEKSDVRFFYFADVDDKNEG